MYGTSGPSELGYANAAILVALLDKLIQKGVIGRPDAIEVLGDAVAAMKPHVAITSIGKAIGLIQESIVPKINK
jgi:hypothetical protein